MSALVQPYDWRDRYILRLREALPVGETRHMLVVAVAGAKTPGDAAKRVEATMFGKVLTTEQRHDMTILLASLTNQHMQEAP